MHDCPLIDARPTPGRTSRFIGRIRGLNGSFGPAGEARLLRRSVKQRSPGAGGPLPLTIGASTAGGGCLKAAGGFAGRA